LNCHFGQGRGLHGQTGGQAKIVPHKQTKIAQWYSHWFNTSCYAMHCLPLSLTL